jgi:peroxiredoxin
MDKRTDMTEKPDLGDLLPDFALPSGSGRPFRISDLRGDRNLVVAWLDPRTPSGLSLLTELAGRHREMQQRDAQVIAVVPLPEAEVEGLRAEHALPFTVLPDVDGKAGERLGVGPGAGAEAIYLTDRYHQIFMCYRAEEADRRPTSDEILQRLDYIEIQCPE